MLWNFGLVIQFPPGSTALIPSALICHSNSTIQPGETRFSVVQYASGRVFRWVSNGFITDKGWLEKATAKEREAWKIERAGRWKSVVECYSTLQEPSETGERSEA